MTTAPGDRIVRAIARLVPASHREEWLDEWRAELAYSSLPPSRLRLRALGALSDALWLRRRYGASSRLDSTMLAHDVRFAARSLLRRPGYAAVLVTTLALCIGATTSVFSIVESVLVRGLAYRDLDRLVAVWSNNPKEKKEAYQVSVGDYFDWRDRSRSFEQLAGFFPTWNVTYTAPDVAERIAAGAVSANFLRTLGVRPQLGRDFAPGEDARGAAPVAILSHAFWSRTFHEDPSVLGKVVTLDGRPFVVAGVMGPDFTFPQNKVDVIAPLPILGNYLVRREVHLLSVIGRLRPGVSIEQARAELGPITQQLQREHPKEDAGLGITVRPLESDLLGDVRRPILVLFAAVCAVLLIGCANVANMMLARSTGRRQELAVRAAMGAEPRAIARQLLVESALIAGIAGVLGIAVAFGATNAVGNVLPVSIARIGQLRVDSSVLAFTLGVCVVVALLCGVAPAVRGARAGTRDALTDAARGSSRGRRARRLHDVLVVAELALALVLVSSAGLLINSFARIVALDPGFHTSHLVRMKIALPGTATYLRGPREREQFYDALIARSAALPGVQSAGIVSRFPFFGHLTAGVFVEGASYAVGDQLPSVEFRHADENYFNTMGIPLLAGRPFERTDNTDSTSQGVVIINRAASMFLFGTPNSVGKRLRFGTAGPFSTVVGVVGDIRDQSPRERPLPQLFLPTRQTLPSDVSLVVRYTGDMRSVVTGVRGIVASLNKNLPVFGVQSIEEIMSDANRGDRFTMALLSGFALLALVLAALGTYGVIAYGVGERTREIGVRMALGARAGEVQSMILREGVVLFGIALPLALLGIWWANRALSGLLFEVRGSDPTTIAGAITTLAAVTVAACFIPARRAANVDPTIAIRS